MLFKKFTEFTNLAHAAKLLAIAGAILGVAACSENIDAGKSCPLLCPEQAITLADTTIDAVVSDTTVLGLPNQIDGAGNGLQGMVEGLVAQGVDIRLCRTCALARGLGELPLIPGTSIGTLVELAEATLLADKVITF